ncbi:vWA domain-containing protein [Treponema primitia]|uniref:vWA domain-containing protein n=1 Tax=Treponema primitia TaxID=88058 RepID=UPI0002554E63|nr:VWA domain-containing protein [Treponema primitia]
MSLVDDVEMPRRTMVLFFVIDSSGSMDGDRIESVNSSIREVLPDIQEISDENADAEIKIAVLEFSSGVLWLTVGGPMPLDQFRWNDIKAAGVTDFGAACRELNDKLSTKAFMKDATGSFAPAIFLMSDGEPTDNWKDELTKLKTNNWFKSAIKAAIAIGHDANTDVLKEFTGSIESVFEIQNKHMLKRMIRFVSVTASRVASKSSNAGSVDGDEAKQAELNAGIKEELQEAQTEAKSNPSLVEEVW